MRILALNIRAGGTGERIDDLLRRALAYDAHVYVFSEYRDTNNGARIRARLRGAGRTHQAFPSGQRSNGVLVAASVPFEPVYNPAGLPPAAYPNAMIECVFPDWHLVGCYLPGQDRKRPHLCYLIRFAQALNEQNIPAMAIGDFNSGRNETDIEANVAKARYVDAFSTADLYGLLERQWTEAWLHVHPAELEYSWYPHMGAPQRRNGWRLDKAFASNALLGRVRDAFYDHTFRLDGLTDHSALIVDLAE